MIPNAISNKIKLIHIFHISGKKLPIKNGACNIEYSITELHKIIHVTFRVKQINASCVFSGVVCIFR